MLTESESLAYYELYNRCGLGSISPSEASDVLDVDGKYAKKIMYQLRKNHAAVRKQWGEYQLVEPEKLAGAQSIMYRFPKEFETIAGVLGPQINDATLMVLHGSWAKGEARKDSDIDIVIGLSKRVQVEQVKKPASKRLSVEYFYPETFSQLPFKHAIVFYFACKEGIVGFGRSVAETIAKKRFKRQDMLEALDESLDMLKISEDLLDLREDKGTIRTAIYSATLRLRLAHDVRCYLECRSTSIRSLKESFSMDSGQFDRVLGIYRLERDDIIGERRRTRRVDEKVLDTKTGIGTKDATEYIKRVGRYIKETKRMVADGKQEKSKERN